MEADVRGYCESMDRTCRREVLRQRGNDGSLWRLIGKWLRAGVMEHGELPPRRQVSCTVGSSPPYSPI